MLTYHINHTVPQHKCISESTVMNNAYNNYTIVNRDDIRKKLNYLHNKNALLSITVPGKFATSNLLTTITHIEGKHIFMEGFQNERFNKDLLMQNTLVVSADLEGIAVNFILSDIAGATIDNTFNIKAAIPQSIEWVQRREARRVKVPINTPVKIQFKHQAGYFNVADISIAGLSYIDLADDYHSATIGGLHNDCNIILPDQSAYVANFEIVNHITIPSKRAGQINRVGCELKQASFQLDTALQHLINQIDFFYQ